MTETQDQDFGVLVGWTATHTGDRISLHVQTVSKPPPFRRSDIKTQFYMFDRNQATQLANFLFELGATKAPEKRQRGWLKRMFG